MLHVCVASTEVDYATTGDVMFALLGATSTAVVASTQEIDQMGRLVRRGAAWVETQLGYPLGVATYQETLPAAGGRHLVLSRTPIRAVLRLFDATDTGEAVELDACQYRVEDAAAGLLSRDRGWDWSMAQRVSGGDFNLGLTPYHQPGMERRPWLVEYVAGFVPLGGLSTSSDNYSTAGGSTSTAATLPEDLRQAVALRAAEFHGNALNIRSRRIGDLAVEYGSAGPAGGGGSAADALLAPYVRR